MYCNLQTCEEGVRLKSGILKIDVENMLHLFKFVCVCVCVCVKVTRYFVLVMITDGL
jgi:hypothetical protein